MSQELAQRIAERLFTNGAGEKAARLVLELPNKGDGGGWCLSAVEDQIAEQIATLTRDKDGLLDALKGAALRMLAEGHINNFAYEQIIAQAESSITQGAK